MFDDVIIYQYAELYTPDREQPMEQYLIIKTEGTAYVVSHCGVITGDPVARPTSTLEYVDQWYDLLDARIGARCDLHRREERRAVQEAQDAPTYPLDVLAEAEQHLQVTFTTDPDGVDRAHVSSR